MSQYHSEVTFFIRSTSKTVQHQSLYPDIFSPPNHSNFHRKGIILSIRNILQFLQLLILINIRNTYDGGYERLFMGYLQPENWSKFFRITYLIVLVLNEGEYLFRTHECRPKPNSTLQLLLSKWHTTPILPFHTHSYVQIKLWKWALLTRCSYAQYQYL